MEAPGIGSLYSSTGRSRALERATAVYLKSSCNILIRIVRCPSADQKQADEQTLGDP